MYYTVYWTYFKWDAPKPRKEDAVFCPQALMNVPQTDIRNNLQRFTGNVM